MLNGAAISCCHSSPTVSDCRITENLARSGTGAIYCEYSAPRLDRCFIIGNKGESGGRVQLIQSNAILNECIIRANWGGGISCLESSPVITNCLISGNAGDYANGGVDCYDPSPTIAWCTISDNGGSGGMSCHKKNNPIIHDCIIAGNNGVGIHEYDWEADPTVTGCLFYDNRWGDYGDENGEPVNGADKINALPDGRASKNRSGDPKFSMGPERTITTDAEREDWAVFTPVVNLFRLVDRIFKVAEIETLDPLGGKLA